jgi:cell division protein FtsW
MSKDAIWLFFISLTLICIGIVMTYSASGIYADQVMGNAAYFLIRQVMFFLIGLVLLVGFSLLNPSLLQKYSLTLMLLSILFLLTVYVPFISHTTRNTRRWLTFCGVNFQPAEFTKLTLCIYFADYLTRKRRSIARGGIRPFIPPLAILMVTSVLILVQPDLGTVVILFALSAIFFFLSGLKQRYIWCFLIGASVVSYFAIIKVPYRMSRIVAYLNPWSDPQGSGFQIIQSFLAFALGGIKGVGLGESTQKLFYLPQSYTDFIFSIVGEESGFFGTSIIVTLFLLFCILGLRIAHRQREGFNKLLSLGLVFLITIQVVINILVATGLLPTKGLPLPFISYGGSSLLINMIAVGIIIGIDRVQYKIRRS